MSMNAFFGRSDNTPGTLSGRSWAFGGQYRQFLKLKDIPEPSMTWLTLDEHPDTINDAFFITDPAADGWQDKPASYHNGACGFSFADGHAEIKKWLSPASKYEKVIYREQPTKPFGRDRRDIDWYKQRLQMIPFR
jgi:prepilin-type processing-associated H-X9-DG protein